MSESESDNVENEVEESEKESYSTNNSDVERDDSAPSSKPSMTGYQKPVLNSIKIGQWISVKFTDRKYFAGLVQKVYGNSEFEVKFVRHRCGSTYFWPNAEDVSDVEFPQIVKILRTPKESRRGEIILEEANLM